LSGEFTDWMAYYSIEPFGEERADLRVAIGHALLANINTSSKRRKVYKPSDFMPFIPREKRELAAAKKFKAELKAYGGKRTS